MSLIATRLQNWRVENPFFDRNMTRPCEYGALDFFIEQTKSTNSIVNENLLRKAEMSIGNTVQIPVINKDETVTVASSRTCVISDDENDSALYNVTWKTYSVGFTMTPSLYMNNEISYEHDFARKMEKITRALADALDKSAVASLEASKTKVLKEKLNYTFSADVVDVPTTMETEILGDLNPMMRANCFPRTIHIVGNAGIDALTRKLAQHGLYNDVNKTLEFDNKVFHYSNNVTNEEMKSGTLYAVEDGNVGVLTRVDRAALRGEKVGDHEFGKTMLPMLNIPVGYHYYKAIGDQSAIAGDASADMVCDSKEYFGFSVDVAFIVAYNNKPTTIANPIIKAQIASKDANVPVAMPVYVTNAKDFPAGV